MNTEFDNNSISDIIKIALDLDPESDEYWDAVSALWHKDAQEITAKAGELCSSTCSRERILGVNMLAQLRPVDKALQAAAKDIVLDVLMTDTDVYVILSAAHAEGHLEDPRAMARLVELHRHPDEDVRYAVVHGLGWRREESSVSTLIKLMDDCDADVRNWVTFYVGQMDDMDSPEIREALLHRTDDEESEVRGEALRGLAQRGDQRVIEPLIREIRAIAEAKGNYWDLAFEAAMEMGETRLYLELVELKKGCEGNEWFDKAIAACRIPAPNEEEEPDDLPTTCPVCGLKNAFDKTDGLDYCTRCGWYQDIDHQENHDLTDGWNRRSLNQERKRWKMRLEEGSRAAGK